MSSGFSLTNREYEMIWFFLFTIAAFVSSIVAAWIFLDWDNEFVSAIGCVGSVLVLFASLIAMVAMIPLSLEWRGAEVKARVINREYGTNYAQDEVFYASSVIDLIRELDRRRPEGAGP